MNTPTKAAPLAKKPGTYAGLAGMLSGGFDTSLSSDANDQLVSLDDIEILAQDRTEFEDDENKLADLGRSLRQYQIQALVLRPSPAGSAKPYWLVAGERRIRAARIEGLTHLRAHIKPMTDEEAADIQFAENTHRKNLTQIEAAKRVQKDLDELGSVEAVLLKHKKSGAWLSKMVGLLRLSEQARRLIEENISADIELIHSVRTIEKADPAKAKELVNELKATRGKDNAREKVAAAKETVKPKRNPPTAGESVATPKNRAQEAPAGARVLKGKAARATDVLGRVYEQVFDKGSSPGNALKGLAKDDEEAVTSYLVNFYEAGKQCKTIARAVRLGLQSGDFAPDGAGALALVAFLHGTEAGTRFVLLNVFGCIKAEQ